MVGTWVHGYFVIPCMTFRLEMSWSGRMWIQLMMASLVLLLPSESVKQMYVLGQLQSIRVNAQFPSYSLLAPTRQPRSPLLCIKSLSMHWQPTILPSYGWITELEINTISFHVISTENDIVSSQSTHIHIPATAFESMVFFPSIQQFCLFEL